MQAAYLAARTALLAPFRPDSTGSVEITGADIQSARIALRKDVQAALMEDPQRDVWAPGSADDLGGRAYVPAVEVFGESLGEERMHVLLRLLADAARGDDTVQLRASLLLSNVAAEHANFHAADAARIEARA